MPSSPSLPPTKHSVRFEISTPAPSEIPTDFPSAFLEAMPEWKNLFAYYAKFDAVFLAPLTETATPVEIHERYSTFPIGKGEWGENPKTILAQGSTPAEKLADFVTKVKAVYGSECSIGFITGSKNSK